MAFFIEYDETYVAGQHKASSITSLDSGDHPPSLCTTDSCSSFCDPDELKELSFGFTREPQEHCKSTVASISIPSDSWLECPPVQEEQYRLKCNSPLSQDERRVHHVASEHKRRQSIRSGLKQLTEWVPHMKSIPHSKSTLLFKTADYIKRTEKRNRVLRDRLLRLQYRVAQELVQSQQQQPLLQQHEGLLHHRSAIIIPVEDEDDAPIIPCLNIPADEDFGQESLIRESLLCCGKLKLNR